MQYNPYTGDYSKYGLGPQYRFFNGDPLNTSSTDPSAPTTPATTTPLPPLPEIPSINIEALGGGGGDGGQAGGGGQAGSGGQAGDAGAGSPSQGSPTGSGFNDAYTGMVNDGTRAPSMSNLGVSPTVGALASAAIPGLGWASTAANTANTAMNAQALANMGYAMSPGQMVGGALGFNGYSGGLPDAMAAAMSNEQGRAALSGKGPSTADVNAMNESYASAISDRGLAPAGAPTNTNDVSLGTSHNAPSASNINGLGSYSTQAISDDTKEDVAARASAPTSQSVSNTDLAGIAAAVAGAFGIGTSEIGSPAHGSVGSGSIGGSDPGLGGNSGGAEGPGGGGAAGGDAGGQGGDHGGAGTHARGGLIRFAEGGTVKYDSDRQMPSASGALMDALRSIMAAAQDMPSRGLKDYSDALTGYKREYDPVYDSDLVSQEPMDASDRTKELTQTLLPTSAPSGALTAGARINAWHASPYNFDKFDMTKIGMGEGAQAYGHGMYTAGNKDTAQTYLEQFQRNLDKAKRRADALLDRYNGDVNAAQSHAKSILSGLERTYASPKRRAPAQQTLNILEGAPVKPTMYEVGIHAPEQSLLDWDKPLQGQSSAVMRALEDHAPEIPLINNMTVGQAFPNLNLRHRDVLADALQRMRDPVWAAEEFDRATKGAWPGVSNRVRDSTVTMTPAPASITGERAYESLRRGDTDPWIEPPDGSAAAASNKLLNAGVPGIKYLDGLSRADGTGTHNYVVFDDKLMEILKKYGVAGAGAAGTAEGAASMYPASSSADDEPKFARGGLAQAAQQVASAGRHGDTELVHLGPAEVKILDQIFGPSTRNPETGYPEHFNFGNFLKSIIPSVAGIVTRSLTGGNDLAGAAVTGLTSKLLGGSTTDALTGAALQYGGGKLAQGLGGSGSFLDNITGPVTDFNNLGTGPIQSALTGDGYNPSSVPVPLEKPPVPGSDSYGTTAPLDASSSTYQPQGGASGLLNIAKNALTSTPTLLAVGAGALNEARNPGTTAASTAAPSPNGPANPYSSEPLKRDKNEYQGDYYTYGMRPQFSFFTPVNAPPALKAARGGLAQGGGALNGGDKGQADTIPAKLSDGEFVIPADVVADLGDGNNEAGAQQLYGLMDSVRSHKAVKGHPPKAKSISAYLQERRP